jgi:large subunit ribosomal protein L27
LIEQYVIPGNIIFRQRGTHWFPGENCAMGRDHTIYATQPGYVKYYADPERHPKRKYIGVVFKREQVLPLPRNSVRRRRLGLVASKAEAESAADEEVSTAVVDAVEGKVDILVTRKEAPRVVKLKQVKGQEQRVLTLRPGYMYRESNWEIGRAAEKAKVQVREFKPGDRWTAWRKASVRRAKNAERRGLSRKVR